VGISAIPQTGEYCENLGCCIRIRVNKVRKNCKRDKKEINKIRS
jgi:hypothetical protein